MSADPPRSLVSSLVSTSFSRLEHFSFRKVRRYCQSAGTRDALNLHFLHSVKSMSFSRAPMVLQPAAKYPHRGHDCSSFGKVLPKKEVERFFLVETCNITRTSVPGLCGEGTRSSRTLRKDYANLALSDPRPRI